MEKPRRLALMRLPAILAVVGSTWGVEHADAETIEMFTGSWRVSQDASASRDNQSLDRLEGAIGSSLLIFSFDGAIGDYSDQGCMPVEPACPDAETWSGTFAGGSVFFAAVSQHSEYSFTGRITGGSFWGEWACDFVDFGCAGGNEARLTFASSWANGWSSVGTLSVDSCFGECGPLSVGTLSMTTSSIPEPESMTLLGGGMAALMILARKRTGVPISGTS